MRHFFRSLVIESLGRLRSISPGIHILNGHYISADGSASEEIFYKQVQALKKHADFVDPITACQLINDKKTSGQTLISMTFDDGFEECYTKIAPVLDASGIKAGFFINPNFHTQGMDYQKKFLQEKVNNLHHKPMSLEMIKNLADNLHVIGAHTMDHQRLNIEDEDALKYQIVNCKEEVEKITAKPCEAFAWPYGTMRDINPVSEALMLEHYSYVFSSCHHQYYKIKNQIYTRRHFEGNWPMSNMKYFMSAKQPNIDIL